MLTQVIIHGLVNGSLYALLAVGFALICGILRMITFAHGDVMMVGAFIALGVISWFGFPFVVGLGVGMIGALVLGIIIERVAFRNFQKESHLTPALITIGFSISLQALVLILAGAETKPYPNEFSTFRLNIDGAIISGLEIAVIATAVTLMLLLHLFIRKTKWGLAVRATSIHYEAAGIMGINTKIVVILAFGLASMLAGAAGLMLGVYYGAFYPQMGVAFAFKALAAATFGGITSMSGAIVGAILLGLIESLSILVISSGYKDAVAFSVLILVLLLKPAGLFGRISEEKV